MKKFPPPPSPKFIVEARLNADLTQTDAAALIYKSVRTWQQWEAGDRAMDPALIELFLLKTVRTKCPS